MLLLIAIPPSWLNVMQLKTGDDKLNSDCLGDSRFYSMSKLPSFTVDICGCMRAMPDPPSHPLRVAVTLA